MKGDRLNEQLLQKRPAQHRKSGSKPIVVLYDFVSLENYSMTFQRCFFNDDGSDMIELIVSQYTEHFVLLFDNTNFTPAMALANPTTNPVAIPVNIRNQAGQIIGKREIRQGSYSHTAFTLPDTWASIAGRRGTIEVLTYGFGVAARGLCFSAVAFTSFHALEN